MDGGLTIARPLHPADLGPSRFLADIDLEPGEAALLSGGDVFLYCVDDMGPEAHACDEHGCDHASDCAVHNEPAYPAGPCDCGLAA